MKQIKKVTALLLAFMMILTILPTTFAAETDFEDVASDIWYAEAVSYVEEKGLMSGTTDTTFSPDTPMSRAMLATVLWRMDGSKTVEETLSFDDVETGTWYADAAAWAVSNQIMSGYNAQTFGTNDPVTREQITLMLYRYAPHMEQDVEVAGALEFTDTADISDWAADSVNWAKQTGIVSGKEGNKFDPQGDATRAQVAVILMNYLSQVTAEPEAPEKPEPEAQAKTLVVYFSMPETTTPNNMTTEEENSAVVIDGEVLGNTQYVAYIIEEHTGADIFRIEPETPYPTDHSTLVDLASDEKAQAARPQLSALIENLDDYDTIFLGYPNWWGDMPMILYTFLEAHDLSGKTIIPFNTHGGSGFSSSINTIARLQPDATVERDGYSVSRDSVHNAKDNVIRWLEGLGFEAVEPTEN